MTSLKKFVDVIFVQSQEMARNLKTRKQAKYFEHVAG